MAAIFARSSRMLFNLNFKALTIQILITSVLFRPDVYFFFIFLLSLFFVLFPCEIRHIRLSLIQQTIEWQNKTKGEKERKGGKVGQVGTGCRTQILTVVPMYGDNTRLNANISGYRHRYVYTKGQSVFFFFLFCTRFLHFFFDAILIESPEIIV